MVSDADGPLLADTGRVVAAPADVALRQESPVGPGGTYLIPNLPPGAYRVLLLDLAGLGLLGSPDLLAAALAKGKQIHLQAGDDLELNLAGASTPP